MSEKESNEKETEGACCKYGRKAEVSSEGSLCCRQCAMEHAK